MWWRGRRVQVFAGWKTIISPKKKFNNFHKSHKIQFHYICAQACVFLSSMSPVLIEWLPFTCGCLQHNHNRWLWEEINTVCPPKGSIFMNGAPEDRFFSPNIKKKNDNNTEGKTTLQLKVREIWVWFHGTLNFKFHKSKTGIFKTQSSFSLTQCLEQCLMHGRY